MSFHIVSTNQPDILLMNIFILEISALSWTHVTASLYCILISTLMLASSAVFFEGQLDAVLFVCRSL